MKWKFLIILFILMPLLSFAEEFRNVSWGMSQKEVEIIEDKDPNSICVKKQTTKEGYIVLVYNVSIYSYHGQCIYYFSYDYGLIRSAYAFHDAKNYFDIAQILIIFYGNPKRDTELGPIWDNGHAEILLMQEDNDIYILIDSKIFRGE